MLFSPRKKERLENRKIYVGEKNIPILKFKNSKELVNITNHSFENEIDDTVIINHLSQEMAAYKQISTLPIIDNQKQGEPLADSFSIYFKTNSFIVVAAAVISFSTIFSSKKKKFGMVFFIFAHIILFVR